MEYLDAVIALLVARKATRNGEPLATVQQFTISCVHCGCYFVLTAGPSALQYFLTHPCVEDRH